MLMKGVSLGKSLELFSFASRGMLIRELIRGPIGGSKGLLLDIGRFCRIRRICGSAGEKVIER